MNYSNIDRKEKILKVSGVKEKNNIDINLITNYNKKEENGFRNLENEPIKVTVQQSITYINNQIYKPFGSTEGVAQSHGGETWKPRLSQKQVTVQQSYGFKTFSKERVVIPSVARKILLFILLSSLFTTFTYAATSIELTTGNFINMFGNLNLSGNKILMGNIVLF